MDLNISQINLLLSLIYLLFHEKKKPWKINLLHSYNLVRNISKEKKINEYSWSSIWMYINIYCFCFSLKHLNTFSTWYSPPFIGHVQREDDLKQSRSCQKRKTARTDVNVSCGFERLHKSEAASSFLQSHSDSPLYVRTFITFLLLENC